MTSTPSTSIEVPAPMDTLPFRSNSKGVRLDPRTLLKSGKIDWERLGALNNTSLVHAKDLDRESVVALARSAALLESVRIEETKPLDGKIAITAFFEASTRTRLSFESAVLRLDGKVLSVPDGQVTGIAKGESLVDIGEMFNTYGDVVIMRHPTTESVDEIRQNLAVPLINAGNGSGQHPTQGLLDWYALLKWRPTLASPDCPKEDRIHLGIVGTPGSMRAVKSFVRIALRFAGAVDKITIVSEMADPVGLDLGNEVENSSIDVNITNNLQDVVSDLDVIYMNSIALLGDSYKRLDSRFKLSPETGLKPGAVVMHPLARNNELDPALDDTMHNLYFAQAAGAVFSRQALLCAVLGRVGRLADIAGR